MEAMLRLAASRAPAAHRGDLIFRAAVIRVQSGCGITQRLQNPLIKEYAHIRDLIINIFIQRIFLNLGIHLKS